VSTGHGHGDGPVAEELAADVVGRALHALEPDEEGRVAEHLRECAVCRALLSETHETMAALAHALPSQEPPAGLRTRILTAAAGLLALAAVVAAAVEWDIPVLPV